MGDSLTDLQHESSCIVCGYGDMAVPLVTLRTIVYDI
jgi:hypothetical protein